ncbi:hypothetical protein [Kiloniella sp.]|uniref:hypothetical protein n=1 Tax=Kiloniella sp. TaxID=1938587 RepID=UPI003B01B90E
MEEFYDKFTRLFGINYSAVMKLGDIERLSFDCGISFYNVVSQTIESSSILNLRDFFLAWDLEITSANLNALQKRGHFLKRCGDFREFKDASIFREGEEVLCNSLINFFGNYVSFHRAASNIMELLYNNDGEYYHKELFLAALANKHNDDYKPYLSQLRKYVLEQPDKIYADDAYAEIGWFYLI